MKKYDGDAELRVVVRDGTPSITLNGNTIGLLCAYKYLTLALCETTELQADKLARKLPLMVAWLKSNMRSITSVDLDALRKQREGDISH